jgi:hypothetical protein
VAKIVPGKRHLVRRKREGQTLLFLEALLRQKPLGKVSWRALVNPDTGCPIETEGVRLSVLDFDKKRLHEIVGDQKGGRTRYSALWQADRTKIARMAPVEYIGRYMYEWWDYAVADELHQLANLTAQGNALGILARAAKRFLGLTGTLLSGYADDLFNTLFRTNARQSSQRATNGVQPAESDSRVISA